MLIYHWLKGFFHHAMQSNPFFPIYLPAPRHFCADTLMEGSPMPSAAGRVSLMPVPGASLRISPLSPGFAGGVFYVKKGRGPFLIERNVRVNDAKLEFCAIYPAVLLRDQFENWSLARQKGFFARHMSLQKIFNLFFDRLFPPARPGPAAGYFPEFYQNLRFPFFTSPEIHAILVVADTVLSAFRFTKGGFPCEI